MIVGILGDLEGDRDWALAQVRTLGQRGDVAIAYQLGDLRFGMGSEPEAYLDALEAVCAEFGLRLHCIGGNHENWNRLEQAWVGDPSRVLPLTEHIGMLPRGHRWELGGRSFVALGGAPSVNRHLLTEDVDWWPGEIVTEQHVEAVVRGGPAEVMLTHDSPGPPYCTEPVAEIIEGNPWGWPEESLAYARVGIDRVTRAVSAVAPRLLVHGHFHVAGEAVVRLPGAGHDTTIWSLAANRQPGNLRLLDLDTLTDPVTGSLT